MEPIGSLRKPLEAFGRLRKPLEAFGSLWKPSDACGRLWKPSEASGNLRKPSEAYHLTAAHGVGLERVDVSMEHMTRSSTSDGPAPPWQHEERGQVNLDQGNSRKKLQEAPGVSWTKRGQLNVDHG